MVCSQFDPALRQYVERKRKESERQKCCFNIFLYTNLDVHMCPTMVILHFSPLNNMK